MAHPHRAADARQSAPDGPPPALFRRQTAFDPADLPALAYDIYCWLEEVWRLPIRRPYAAGERDPFRLLPPARATPEALYTLRELGAWWGVTPDKVAHDLTRFRIQPAARLPRIGALPESGASRYRGHDLAPVLDHWAWQRLCRVLDGLWDRFAAERCGACSYCRCSPHVAANCGRHNGALRAYRRGFLRLLRGVRTHGSVAAWWRHEGAHALEQRAPRAGRGVVLLYLLDRRLLDLSYDELLRLRLPDLRHDDLLRPWRNRRPDEYAAFVRGVAAAGYTGGRQRDAIRLLVIMVLLKHGLPGVAELARPLAPDELARAIREDRLLTRHLCYGVFLPCTLTGDIRAGHVALDEVRHCLWACAAETVRQTGRPHWEAGVGRWRATHVRTVEFALVARVWGDGEALLPRRPDIDGVLINPYRVRREAEAAGYALALLPPPLQEALRSHLAYRYQEQRIALGTLRQELHTPLTFLGWARERGTLDRFARWDGDELRRLWTAFRADRLAGNGSNTVYAKLQDLHTFFQSLRQLGRPYPPGYEVLPTLLPAYDKTLRQVPREEVMDRIFREGVCHLDHDPFCRLALTIQYFCGTRRGETCDLHLFCVLEDGGGGAYLTIPRGKTRRERLFPIVAVGMGTLLQFMDEVVAGQLRPDGIPKALAQTNYRYLDDDPEQAANWYYLFDRSTSERPNAKRPSRLSPSRLGAALREAILLAALVNPHGLFQEGTHAPDCRRRRRRGERCNYIALRNGITACPICGSTLSGTRGDRCPGVLVADFACDGRADDGAYFCPKCDAALATLLPVGTHAFRHNSVTRAHRHGVSLEQNMALHGHQTVPMHLRYVHLLPEDLAQEVCRVLEEKRVREVYLVDTYAPGQVVEGGVAHTATLPEYLGLTLRRGLKRRTYGVWGGFWAHALANQGATSPLLGEAELVVTEDTYPHTVAQYRYEALGLAVSELALERGTAGTFTAAVPPFLDRREVERLVLRHQDGVREYLRSPLGVRLMEKEVREQRAFLGRLAALLRPWWDDLGSVDALVRALTPGGIDVFQSE